MSKPDEQTSTNEPTEETTAEAEAQAGTDKPAEAEVEVEAEKPAEAEAETEEGNDELPEWAREKLTKANTEAASYRTKLREAEAKAKTLKSPEDVEKAVADATTSLTAENRALLIENISLTHGLPKPLQNRLVGNTREELEADAKVLASQFDIEEIHLEGGLRPKSRKNPDANLSAGELAKKYGSRKRR